jgi:hypothetical protein
MAQSEHSRSESSVRSKGTAHRRCRTAAAGTADSGQRQTRHQRTGSPPGGTSRCSPNTSRRCGVASAVRSGTAMMIVGAIRSGKISSTGLESAVHTGHHIEDRVEGAVQPEVRARAGRTSCRCYARGTGRPSRMRRGSATRTSRHCSRGRITNSHKTFTVRGSGGYSMGSEILLAGEPPFADAAPCRAVAPARAPQTRRPPPPGPPERVVSGSASAAAPHRGGGGCRLGAARLRCGCLADAAAAREERRGRRGRSPRRSPGRPGCRPTLWRARPGVVGPWRTRGANGGRRREPRSGRASEWLARPTAR